MDFTVRRRKAGDDARPFRETESIKKEEAERARVALSSLKSAKSKNAEAIKKQEEVVAALLRESRDAAKKAQAIEDAVYDLKAVNPNRKAEVDSRTPGQLLDLIEAKGREIAEALAFLRA